MTVPLALRKGESLYQKLKGEARRDRRAARQVELLDEVLTKYRIVDNPQHDVCAEAILRFLLLEEMNSHRLSFDPKDGKMTALRNMAQEYQHLLASNELQLHLSN
jgi:hypothetical protein